MIFIRDEYYSIWASTAAWTLPPKIDYIYVEEKGDDTITISWQKVQKIAEGVEFLDYVIKYEAYDIFVKVRAKP